MLYVIFFAIAIVCALIVFFIIKKHAHKLDRFDGEVEQSEKQAEIKKQLIENKLKKKFSLAGSKISDSSKVASSKLKQISGNWSLKFKKVLPKKRKEKPVKLEKKEKTNGNLIEAQVLLKQRKFDEAEKKFMLLLKEDTSNLDIYMGLGAIYMAKKDFVTAEETFLHVLKKDAKNASAYKEISQIFKIQKKWQDLKKNGQLALDSGLKEAWIYINMGVADKKMGYPEKAEELFKKAVETEPENEAFLDYLFEVSIINKNRELAGKTLNTLKNISTDEIKLQSYRDKLDIL